MFTFNSRGFLIPNTNIKATLTEFKTQFVDNITNPKRSKLYENYLNYSNDLKKVLNGQEFTQWIDGSFVTKKEEPADIDLISFIDGMTTAKLGNMLHPFKYPQSVKGYEVDAYLVLTYNQGDPKYPLFIADRMYWMDHFDKTRRSRRGKKHPKGFLEIMY